MSVITELVNKYYEKFAGLPNQKPIVRNNTPEDAFTLVTLEVVMYSHGLQLNIVPEDIEKISKVIVAPPDSGIDLFIEIEDGDECYYDVIQSKYKALTESEIQDCFSRMKYSIQRYLRNPNTVQENLRNVISETSFNKSFKNNCTYYVFHTGELNYGNSFNDDENIVTVHEMEVTYNSLNRADCRLKVPYAEFTADMFNNYIFYENSSDKAMLCNIRGYDLAELCNKYISSSIGRNILFGQNLRDSLSEKKSKTFEAMKNTIEKEPEKFWYYNNGITVICEELDANHEKRDKKVDLIQIKNFSIINGAQTTSALGAYLRNAMLNKDEKAIEQLKKVYVLVRIMEVNDETLQGNISIYNNLQNPISSRDQVANNYEQNQLHKRLIEGESPNIFVEIRRGQDIPAQPRFEKHQQVSNEDLAQLAFAAFDLKPYKAKAKKKNLFNKENDTNYIVNADYDNIFYCSRDNEKKGILFEKSKKEIDEALFIKYLYTQSKNQMKKYYDEKIAECNKKIEAGKNVDLQTGMIQGFQRNKEINNTCMIYCVALYFYIRNTYADMDKEYTFNYFEFYRNSRNSTYKQDIIKYFSENFLRSTIEIMGGLLSKSGSGSATNWLRKEQSETEFFEELKSKMTVGMTYQDMYEEFIKKFAI